MTSLSVYFLVKVKKEIRIILEDLASFLVCLQRQVEILINQILEQLPIKLSNLEDNIETKVSRRKHD